MTIVKITVLETSLKKDLADEYAVPNLEPCPVLKAGQVFYATNMCPKGMCCAAWRAKRHIRSMRILPGRWNLHRRKAGDMLQYAP